MPPRKRVSRYYICYLDGYVWSLTKRDFTHFLETGTDGKVPDNRGRVLQGKGPEGTWDVFQLQDGGTPPPRDKWPKQFRERHVIFPFYWKRGDYKKALSEFEPQQRLALG